MKKVIVFCILAIFTVIGATNAAAAKNYVRDNRLYTAYNKIIKKMDAGISVDEAIATVGEPDDILSDPLVLDFTFKSGGLISWNWFKWEGEKDGIIPGAFLTLLFDVNPGSKKRIIIEARYIYSGPGGNVLFLSKVLDRIPLPRVGAKPSNVKKLVTYQKVRGHNPDKSRSRTSHNAKPARN